MRAPNPSPALTRAPQPATGKLSVMAMFGLVASAVPLPFLPTAALRRVRGAIAHDVATRHGLSLTDEARREMAEPSRAARGGALLTTAIFVARRTLRRVGVLGILPPLSAWLEVYALGLLFDRYLERVRTSSAVRVHGAEARLVRRTIDAAISGALSPRLAARPGLARAEPSEELRSVSTRVIDGVLLSVAGVPDHVRRRLETAFDSALEEDVSHV